MTSASEGRARPAIHEAVSVQGLTAFAGLIGLVSATLAVAGVMATSAYLSAWGVPPFVTRVDPLAAALRSESVIIQSLNLALIVYGVDALLRGLPPRRNIRYGTIGVVVALLFLEAGVSLFYGFLEPTVTVVGGLTILVLHHRGLISPRITAVAFVLVALAAGYVSGTEEGSGVRSDPTFQTSVVLTTHSQVGGLNGVETGSGWTYDGLYLVFRDSAAVYVAATGGDAVWIVPDGSVVSLELIPRR